MYPKKSHLKIKKINPPSFAQALGKHKKESYHTIYVFHSKFQSTHINLFNLIQLHLRKFGRLFMKVKERIFPGKFYYLIQIFHVIHVLPVAFHKTTLKKFVTVVI